MQNLSREMLTKSRSLMPLANSLLSAGAAAEVSDDYDLLDVNEMITKGREGFVAFVITGDSMVDAIRPGYIVFVDSFSEPRNGDTVAACVNGKNCIKIFDRKPNGLYLVSANANYSPKEIQATDSFFILGVVKGHLAVY